MHLKDKPSTDQEDESLKPWYRQFWFWFVFGPLIFIVVLCGFTVSIALKGADDVIIDNYYKEGRMINQALGQDKRASELGLTGDLRFDLATGDVLLKIPTVPSDPALLPQELLLMMGHPVKAARDQLIKLKYVSPGYYRGELDTKPQYSWYLTLYPISDLGQRNQAPWTLSGSINFQLTDTATLTPRVKHSESNINE